MKNKKFNKTKIAILSALFISSSAYASTEKYIFVLDNKSASYVIGGEIQNPDNGDSNPPADPNAGTEKPVPVEGYDYANLEPGTYSSFLRSPDQTTVFGSGETFTFNTGYSVSGSASGTTENGALYLDLLGLKTTYNSSSYQLTVAAIDSMSPSLTLAAQKSGNNLSASVQESYTINYDSSGDVINLNGTQANGKRVFDSTVNLYMQYSGDADNGTFTFENPTPLSQGIHSTINYTDGENAINFTGGELLSFKSGRGFLRADGSQLNTSNNVAFSTNQDAMEGYYEFDNSTGNLEFSAPKTFGLGTYKASMNGSIPNIQLKNGADYVNIFVFSGTLTVDDPNDLFDCVGSGTCVSNGTYRVTYNSGDNTFELTNP